MLAIRVNDAGVLLNPTVAGHAHLLSLPLVGLALVMVALTDRAENGAPTQGNLKKRSSDY